MKSISIKVIIMTLFSIVSFTTYAADIAAGKAKSVVCASCHGADGNSISGAWPSLAEQHPSYLVKQLKNFKSGERANAVMLGMAALLTTEADMQDVAAYYQSQTLKPVKFDDSVIAKGESIFRGGITETSVAACMACHGADAKGNAPAGWPLLKGQQPDYLILQLKSFRDGSRANDPGGMMRGVAARMTDAEIEAVAAYIAGIQ